MTEIATAPDLAAIKQRQQATWASGDYHMIGTQILIVVGAAHRGARRPLDRARPRRRDRQRQRRTGRRPARLHRRRARLRPRAARARPPAGRGRGPRGRVRRGRRRGPAVRRRQLRRRELGLRGDVRAGPGADGERARPRLPVRRPDRPRRPHAGGLHRPAVQDERQARPAAGRPALADPVGHRGAPSRALRRLDRRDPHREAPLRLPIDARRRPSSTTGGATTVRR